jgi:hypothetical protein
LDFAPAEILDTNEPRIYPNTIWDALSPTPF